MQMLWSDPYGGDQLPMATQDDWLTTFKNVIISQGELRLQFYQKVTDPSFKGYFDIFRPYHGGLSLQISWKLLNLQFIFMSFTHVSNPFSLV